MMARYIFLFSTLAALASAQTVDEKCKALLALTGQDLTILRAYAVEATGNVAAHCKVEAQALPEVRIDVFLPRTWNKRFLMRGNGGFAGNMDRGGALTNVKDGYAVGLTDTGHDGNLQPLATFATNRQQLYDYAFRSLHLTVVVSRKLIEAYYGAAPEKSYYIGCSTGGRQGLMFAQRFPNDFDGIVAGAPVLNFTGTMLQYVSITRALRNGPLPMTKVALLSDAIYSKCDALDGLKDGLITDPARCPFKPAQDLKRCDGAEAADCFTAAQIQTLETMYSPVQGASGTVMPGWPLGAEVAGPNGNSGWSDWIIRENGLSIGYTFGESFFRYMAWSNAPKPQQVLTDVDIPTADKALAWLRPILDATDPDLSAFRKRGGKLIMFYGLADPALNPNMGLGYFEAVRQKMGPDVSDFFHYLTLPGVFHCQGGPGCGTVDYLKPLVDWVENGKAPLGIVGSQVDNGKVLRTRPLCSWPKVAQYRGSGDVNAAASFVCAEPRP